MAGLLWSHQHMDASAIGAQEPTGKFRVPQVRRRSDEPSGALPRLQSARPCTLVTYACCRGKTRLSLAVSKAACKIAEYLPRLPLDLLSTCVREDACRIALDSSVFPGHAPIESHC